METKYIDTPEWDKTFALSDKVNHKKVSFTNRYGIRLVGDLYMHKSQTGKLPAIAVCGPYGAVKEQASGLYAQTLAERGFITLAFDPSFSGESGGQPRYISSGEIYTEDYSAAVDFFMLQPEVDRERIGILGICGFGGISINAAVQDTRIKATVSSTMGAFDPYDKEQRYEMRRQLNEQRTADLLAGRANERSGGVPANLPDEIRSAVLVVHGEKAYSLPASQEAFGKLKGDNKELLIIPGASHTDLYDRMDIIPFDKIEAFFRKYLR